MTLIYFRISKMTVKVETLILLLSNIFLIKIHGFNNHYRKDITSLCSYMAMFEIYIPQTTHYMWRDRARVDRCIVLFWHRQTGSIPSSALWGLCSPVCLMHCSPLLRVSDSSVSIFWYLSNMEMMAFLIYKQVSHEIKGSICINTFVFSVIAQF